MIDQAKKLLENVQWSVIMRVPVYYYMIAWLAWVVAYLSRRRKPVVVRPVIVVLDAEGKRQAGRWLRAELDRAGFTAYGADDFGMYWTRDKDGQGGD